MSKHRHEKHAKGGKVGKEGHHKTYVQESDEVEKEAGLKKGGRAKHAEHKAHGGKAHHRKARGGSAGSDKNPLSSAAIKG